MKTIFRTSAAVAGVMALMWAASPTAKAATVDLIVEFSANNFASNPTGISVPVDPVIGSFRIEFDPSLIYSDTTTGITLLDLNIPLGSDLGFTWIGSILTVGGMHSGVNGIFTSQDDFLLRIHDFVTHPTLFDLRYATADSGFTLFTSLTGSVSVTPVPIPAALPLFGTAIAAMGLIGWWRRRRPQTAVTCPSHFAPRIS